jgi:hydrogenase maturation protease
VTPVPASHLIIGIGNAFRSDDGVGIRVARQLRGQVGPGVSVIEATGEGTALLETWRGASSVILIDAVRSGAVPGKIHQLDAVSGPIPAQFFECSSHAFGVGQAVELARVLGQLPPRLTIYGIEGAQFADGAELSPVVARAADKLADQLLAEIRSRNSEPVT